MNKLRSDQPFGDRRVRLGDIAIVCDTMYTGMSTPATWAYSAVCIGFTEDDKPIWRALNCRKHWSSDKDDRIIVAKFVATEVELEPGTLTW